MTTSETNTTQATSHALYIIHCAKNHKPQHHIPSTLWNVKYIFIYCLLCECASIYLFVVCLWICINLFLYCLLCEYLFIIWQNTLLYIYKSFYVFMMTQLRKYRNDKKKRASRLIISNWQMKKESSKLWTFPTLKSKTIDFFRLNPSIDSSSLRKSPHELLPEKNPAKQPLCCLLWGSWHVLH